MFSSEIFHDHDDNGYRQGVLKLYEAIIDGKEDDDEIGYEEWKKPAIEFSENYLTPNEIWDELFKNAEEDDIPKLIKQSAYHFYFYQNLDSFSLATPKRLYDPDSIIYNFREHSLLEGKICYPQKYLDEKMEGYEKYANSFLPLFVRRKFINSKKLYSKIKESEKDDYEKWLNVMEETGDAEFIQDNIEHRICKNLTDKTLWKLYIVFLKSSYPERLLQTYSKYCRFFMDDIEMFEEYQKIAEETGGKVSVPWKNPFDFEITDDQFFQPENKEYNLWSTEESPLQVCFDTNNLIHQTLSFRKPFIDYIFKNAKAEVLHSLYQTCKWCYQNFPKTIFYRIETLAFDGKLKPIEFEKQSLIAVVDTIFDTNYRNIYISTAFKFDNFESNALATFIPRIYKCTAKFVSIAFQQISLKELEFLIGCGNVIDLELYLTEKSEEKYFQLEDILKFAPKIKNLSIEGVEVIDETNSFVEKFASKNIISKFSLKMIIGCIFAEANSWANFIKKNCTPESNIKLEFRDDDDGEEYVTTFEESVKNELIGYWEVENCPHFYVH